MYSFYKTHTPFNIVRFLYVDVDRRSYKEMVLVERNMNLGDYAVYRGTSLTNGFKCSSSDVLWIHVKDRKFLGKMYTCNIEGVLMNKSCNIA